MAGTVTAPSSVRCGQFFDLNFSGFSDSENVEIDVVAPGGVATMHSEIDSSLNTDGSGGVDKIASFEQPGVAKVTVTVDGEAVTENIQVLTA